MEIRRLRELAGILEESVTSDVGTNKDIDNFVERFPAEDRPMYLDAIEAVYDRQGEGITVGDWADYLRRIHGADAPVRDVLVTVAKSLPYVKKIADKTFAWRDPNDADTDDPLRGMVSSQVGLVYDAMEIIKRDKELSEDEWAEKLQQRIPQMSRQAALSYIDHIANQFRGVLKPAGRKRWMYEEPPKQNSMELLKNIVNMRKET